MVIPPSDLESPEGVEAEATEQPERKFKNNYKLKLINGKKRGNKKRNPWQTKRRC